MKMERIREKGLLVGVGIRQIHIDSWNIILQISMRQIELEPRIQLWIRTINIRIYISWQKTKCKKKNEVLTPRTERNNAGISEWECFHSILQTLFLLPSSLLRLTKSCSPNSASILWNSQLWQLCMLGDRPGEHCAKAQRVLYIRWGHRNSGASWVFSPVCFFHFTSPF